jgi:agmatinase
MTTSAFLQHTQACLCPPGNGVFTVNTAKERKAALHQQLFGRSDNIEPLWQQSLAALDTEEKAVILGIASDCGGGILRGANWGPLFLRNELKQDYPHLTAIDLGDVRVIPHLLHDKYLNDATLANCRKALYQDAECSLPISPLSITEFVAREFYQQYPDKGLFGIGGDHSISYPLTKAYLQAKKAQQKRVAIIHFDAHTDLLVERLGIDLCFGSWCTHILADLPAPNHLIQLGIRSSGKPKSHWETTFGVTQHWAHDINQQGADVIAKQVLAQLKRDNVDELYVSFDIDALDSSIASATGTPEPDGLTVEQALTILQALASEFKITGADMMEIAPFTDSVGLGQKAQKITLAAGAKISAFLLEQLSTS